MKWLPICLAVFLFGGHHDAFGTTIFMEDVTFVDGDVNQTIGLPSDPRASVLDRLLEARSRLVGGAATRSFGSEFYSVRAISDPSATATRAGTHVHTYLFLPADAEPDSHDERAAPQRFVDVTAWGSDPIITFYAYYLAGERSGDHQGNGLPSDSDGSGSRLAGDLPGDGTTSGINPLPVPEPSSILVLCAALLSAVWLRRRR